MDRREVLKVLGVGVGGLGVGALADPIDRIRSDPVDSYTFDSVERVDAAEASTTTISCVPKFREVRIRGAIRGQTEDPKPAVERLTYVTSKGLVIVVVGSAGGGGGAAPSSTAAEYTLKIAFNFFPSSVVVINTSPLDRDGQDGDTRITRSECIGG
ncbi:MAG: hypothetical protein ABEJ08_02020 [Halobacteriaceae archaeon]